ncbi:class I SAM-dependent methyltransferase [Peristeroidobacter agariperforans]|uniref:class I SAM-dependent methyltransferase n=1 Tax=Peristeroidobacter agariperforans TaxID=268404 RepID=UPI001E2B5218|nr:MnmC family methyltransferase [Peristeroidobacter agariperforans]
MTESIERRTPGPLLTLKVHDQLQKARRAGVAELSCSLDLDRTTTTVALDDSGWTWQGQRYPYLEKCKERTVYYWRDGEFAPVSRYSSSLIKLVPTEWGTPTFEIDGIKMLVSERLSPYQDAQAKVALIEPRGKVVLDTCGGLGYFAAWCLEGGAARIVSFEKNPDVIWLRSLNPWSPQTCGALSLTQGDVSEKIAELPDASFDAILHDPPRFGIAGELYSQSFYDQLARVLKRGGRMFHYTGAPNKLTTGRDVPTEVATRLKRSGLKTKLHGDGVLASKAGRGSGL